MVLLDTRNCHLEDDFPCPSRTGRQAECSFQFKSRFSNGDSGRRKAGRLVVSVAFGHVLE